MSSRIRASSGWRGHRGGPPLTARGQSRRSCAILLVGAASCRRRLVMKAGRKIRCHPCPQGVPSLRGHEEPTQGSAANDGGARVRRISPPPRAREGRGEDSVLPPPAGARRRRETARIRLRAGPPATEARGQGAAGLLLHGRVPQLAPAGAPP
jgi:hypothetical protein